MANFIRKIIRKFMVKKETIIKPIVVTVPQQELLLGKTALITGGAGGIGFAIAKELKKAGAEVFISGRNEQKLVVASSSLGCKYVVMDIGDIGATELKIEEMFRQHPIDILVNSAGMHGDDPFGKVTEKTYDSVMDVNVKALYFVSQKIANLMIESNMGGHILNVCSASALKPSWTPYEISKRAVMGITEGMAHKLIKHSIVVNGIAPGPTLTPMLRTEENLNWPANPSGRMSMPEEIAALALFMVGPQGDGVVGDTFFITGGSGTIDKEK